jgi:hypothetical protein
MIMRHAGKDVRQKDFPSTGSFDAAKTDKKGR